MRWVHPQVLKWKLARSVPEVLVGALLRVKGAFP
jgi:hypothetical protein